VRQVNLTTGTAGLQFSLGGTAPYENRNGSGAGSIAGFAQLGGRGNRDQDVYEGSIGIYDSGFCVQRGEQPINACLRVADHGTKSESMPWWDVRHVHLQCAG